MKIHSNTDNDKVRRFCREHENKRWKNRLNPISFYQKVVIALLTRFCDEDLGAYYAPST